MQFKTPEEFFLDSTESSDMASLDTSIMGFQPKVHWASLINRPIDTVDPTFKDLVTSFGKNGQELIVLVGSPASGKSSMTGR